MKINAFYKETIFKETPIGKIPNDWEVVRLGDRNVAALIMGQSPPSSTYNKERVGLPFLQGKAEFGEIYPSPILYCSKPIKIAESNDILLSVRAPVGDVNIAPLKCCIGRGLSSIRAKTDKLHYLFLFYHLKFGSKRFESLSMGSTFKAIRKAEIENYKIPLPPLSEQQKIAEILSTVDRVIQKVDELIAKTERLKRGLMRELLTKGLGHKEFKDAEIGRIPKDWEVVRLEKVSKDFISGGTPSTKEPKFWNGNIPWIRSVHITRYFIDHSSVEQYITEEGLEHSAANIVPRNNLIVATRVGVGKSAVNLIDVAINQDLTGIVLDKSKVNPEFIAWYLHSSRVIQLFESFSRGTTIKGITQFNLRNLRIALPSLPEQQKISEILSTVDKKLELERNEKAKLERIKQGLMDLLLTGKIRIKVN